MFAPAILLNMRKLVSGRSEAERAEYGQVFVTLVPPLGRRSALADGPTVVRAFERFLLGEVR